MAADGRHGRWTDREERAYHRAMAELCERRGLKALAASHRIAASDCPVECGCAGCVATRTEAMERRARRSAGRKAA